MKKISLIGRVGQNPEIKQTKTGESFTVFSVAVSEKWNDAVTTTWFDCVAFKKTGELASKFLHKGSKVYLEGNPSIKTYQKKDMTHVSGFSVVVNQLQFLDSVSKEENKTTPEPKFNEDDSELPF